MTQSPSNPLTNSRLACLQDIMHPTGRLAMVDPADGSRKLDYSGLAIGQLGVPHDRGD